MNEQMASLNWDDVRTFLAIKNAGSLTAAAQALGLSQPTMGRRIAALEDATGHKLFQRGKQGFQLTEEGLSIVGYAQQMEEEALAIERQLAGQGSELKGLLRISTSDWWGTYVLSPVIAEFLKRYPQMRVELITDSRVYDLSRREADVVFRIKPIDEPEVVQRKLMHMSYALYGAVGSTSPLDRHAAGLKVVGMNQAFEHTPDAAWLRDYLPNAELVFGSNNREAQARLCALGVGLAVLPTLLGDVYPGLVRLATASSPPGRDVWCAYHQDFRTLARLRAFIDLATSVLPSAA